MKIRSTATLALLGLLALGAGPAASASAPAGLVVEELRRGGAASRAGLQPGDRLLVWERRPPAGTSEPAAGGTLRLPFDLVAVLLEQMPRGDVTLQGERDGQARTWTLPGRSPGARSEVRTAPLLPAELESLLSQGRLRVAAGDLAAGVALWKSAADRARAGGDDGLATWFGAEGARAWARAQCFEEADHAYADLVTRRGEPSPEADAVAAQLLREWGDRFAERRSWNRAVECYSRALALDRRGHHPLAEAASLTGLGRAASLSAGEERAATLLERALDLRQRLAPQSADVAASWAALGQDALSDGEIATAEKHFKRAVEIQRALTPRGLYLAEQLGNLGLTHYWRGDLPGARGLWQQALDLARAAAPEDPQVSSMLQGLGDIALKRRDWARAETYLAESLALTYRLGPEEQESQGTADLLHDLATAERHRGRTEASAEHFCGALALVERLFARLAGGEESRLRWGRFGARITHDCAQALAERGQGEAALEAVERGRAPAFLDLLAERDLRARGVPPERLPEWRQLNADYEEARGQIARLMAAGEADPDPDPIFPLEGRLREIRMRKERILADSLPLDSIRRPAPLRLPEIRRALDPGTLLLVYSVGEEKTLLFTVPAEGEGDFSATVLGVGREALAREVESFRQRIQEKLPLPALRAQGTALYDRLLGPVEPRLGSCRRILIVPDGPLHVLPFAALVRHGRYLIEWVPLHEALSATAYAELRKARRPSPPPRRWPVVAFADPLVPQPELAAELPPKTAPRAAGRRDLASLPATRQEVAALQGIFPQSQLYVADTASEEEVKRASPGARLLHFAVHGLLDGRTPQNSALVLSPVRAPGSPGEDGLLQAWEIMEELRLDADLVTLSACDTALGQERGGEGLIGLTRAFHYAGARSVLATLWGISDGSTTELMAVFYRRLRAGAGKDEALQAAQVALLRSATGAHPFYWAAFELSGDWR